MERKNGKKQTYKTFMYVMFIVGKPVLDIFQNDQQNSRVQPDVIQGCFSLIVF